jgi:hypothetical protein
VSFVSNNFLQLLSHAFAISSWNYVMHFILLSLKPLQDHITIIFVMQNSPYQVFCCQWITMDVTVLLVHLV